MVHALYRVIVESCYLIKSIIRFISIKSNKKCQFGVLSGAPEFCILYETQKAGKP